MTLRIFETGQAPVPIIEKVKSGVAAAAGMFLLALLTRMLGEHHYPEMLLASMGASAVLLYAVPHSPMAQPWPLIGGHLVSAVVGWTAAYWIGCPVLAAACAVGGAVFVMYWLNCLHPPGAATALLCVLNAATFKSNGFIWGLQVVAANTLLSFFAAWLVNNLFPGRHYPAKIKLRGRRVKLPDGSVLTREDIQWAMAKMDSAVDISEQDLLELCKHALIQAALRNPRFWSGGGAA